MTRHEEAAGRYPGDLKSQAVVNRDPFDITPQAPAPSNLLSALNILVDDEDVLRQAVAPLLDMAQRRVLSPPTEEATLRLLDALYAVRRWRRAVEAEVVPWRWAGQLGVVLEARHAG